MTDHLTENARLRAALTCLLEPFEGDPCRYDHHGKCQAHFLEEECCVAKARAALATPAPDAVQEAARVLLSLMKPSDWYQASHAMSDAEGGVRSQDERRLSAALRAIAGVRT